MRHLFLACALNVAIESVADGDKDQKKIDAERHLRRNLPVGKIPAGVSVIEFARDFLSDDRIAENCHDDSQIEFGKIG